ILLERRGLGRFRRIRSRRRRLRAGGRISVLRQLLDRRQQRLTLAWQQRDLAMAALQLLVAYDVVLRVRLDRGLGAVADDRRTDEQHQVALFLRAAASLEQLADQRNRAQDRHAVLAFAGGVGDQAAEHDYAAIVDEHGRRDCALVGDQVDRALRALRDAGVFLLDLEHHRVAFVDLRRDLEDRADFLALNRLERIDLSLRVRGARVGERAGEEWHFLRDLDLRLFIVEGDDRRRLQDVRVAVAAQRAQQQREVRSGVEEAAGAESQAGRQERWIDVARIRDCGRDA